MIVRLVALAAALTTAAPSLARAHAPAAIAPTDPDAAYVPTTFEIDTSELGYTSEMAKSIGLWVEEKLRDEHQVPLVAPGESEAVLRVKLSWESEKDSNWRIQVAVDRDSKTTVPEPFVCKGCFTEVEVAERIYEELPKILPLLERSEAAPESAAAAGTAADDGSAPVPESPNDDRKARPLGPMGKAGIPLIVVGAGGLAGGIAMIAVGRVRDDGELDTFDRSGKNFRTPGIGVAIAGGALLAVGTALLVVDRVRARKSRTALLPFAGPGQAGLTFHTRF